MASLDVPAKAEFVSRHPQLLAPYVQQDLLDTVTGAREKGTPASEDLAFLIWARRTLETDPLRYPVGKGPIEAVWKAVTDGEITASYGEEQVRTPEIVTQLSLAYVRGLSHHALETILQGQWQPGWLLQNLILAAAESTPPDSLDADLLARSIRDDFALMRLEVRSAWLLAARAVLVLVPDGRLYASALSLGERLIAQLEILSTAEDQESLGTVCYRLAAICLDPYQGIGTIDETKIANTFELKLRGALPAAELAQVNPAELAMPPLSASLERAEQLLRRSLPLRTGARRGLAIKALLQTLLIREGQGAHVDEQEIRTLAEDALRLLDPVENRDHVIWIQAALRERHDERSPGDNPPKVADQPSRAPGTDQVKSLAAIVQQAQLTALTDQDAALDVLKEAYPIARELGEESRIQTWETAMRILTKRTGPARHRRASFFGLMDDLAALLAQDKEDEALTVLDRAVAMEPALVDHHRDSFDYLRAQLEFGSGANAANSRALLGSVTHYCAALELFISLPATIYVEETLRRLSLILSAFPPREVILELCKGLLPSSLRIQMLGEGAILEFFTVCSRAITSMATSGANETAALLLRQMGKGLGFAAAYDTRVRSGTKGFGAPTPLLARIAAMETEIQNAEGVSADGGGEKDLLAEETLLSSQVESDSPQSGRTGEERSLNIRRRLDRAINSEILSNYAEPYPPLLDVKDVQARLDSRTVLLDLFLGYDLSDRPTTYTFVVTREDIFVTAVPHENASVDASAHSGVGHGFARRIGELRGAITEDPGLGRLVSAGGMDGLRECLRQYIGPEAALKELLDLRDSGKDHMCVVPHGPLHYVPFHLFAHEGQVLADQFVVTYLPNLMLIRDFDRQSTPAEVPFAAIGLSFTQQNPFDLPPLPGSIEETEQIADMFGVTPLLEERATKRAVIDALTSARRVHLSTHGRHTPEASAFQCLYVTSDDSSNGRLAAYELLSYDMRNLELLTLSACETALGRFDIMDNLRGLPAALLLGGVRTVIGSLWNAEVNASRLFFTTFYDHVRSGTSKLDAFALGQQATRRRYPSFRDWGAFYLMGGW